MNPIDALNTKLLRARLWLAAALAPRSRDERGAGNTVEQVMWIAIVVGLVMLVTGVLTNFINEQLALIQ